ncbi:MAG: 50S ribosomal protein L10 [Thermoanaerobaculales bacterium]|nr:50S ribosomal protein L10 [Thermoanaerobaculales bacterium]
MLTREQKRVQSDALREVFSDVNTLFLINNAGLGVNDVNVIRTQVREVEGAFKVVKHSVVKLAIEGTDKEGLGPHLQGPKMLAYTSGDGVALAKVLRNFIKDHPSLSFEEAYMEGELLDAKAAELIAELPSREELISKMLFVLQSPMRRLAVALNSPIQKFVSVLSQVAEQKEA